MGRAATRIWPVLLSVLLLLPIGAQQWRTRDRATPPELRVGVIAHQSGPLAYNGASVVAALQLAAEAINAEGGVRVQERQIPIRLLIRDDRGEPERAVDVARELIFHEQVHALIGPNASRNAIPVGALAEQAGMLMISPTSTHPATTAGRSYVFRVSPLDSIQSHGLATFARDTLQAERAAVIYDVASIYNRNLAESFQRDFEEVGGEIVAFVSYTTGREEFDDLAATVTAAAPDVVLLPNYPEAVAAQVAALQAAGYEGRFLGSDSWGNLEPQLRARLDGAYFTSHFGRDTERAMTQSFIQAYVDRYGSEPADAAALAYDALSLLVAVVEECGTLDATRLMSALQSFGPFEGVTGTLKYQGSGDPARGVSVMTIQNRGVDFVTFLRPIARHGPVN